MINDNEPSIEAALAFLMVALFHGTRIIIAFTNLYFIGLVTIIFIGFYVFMEVISLVGLLKHREEALGLSLGLSLVVSYPLVVSVLAPRSNIAQLFFVVIGILEAMMLAILWFNFSFRVRSDTRMKSKLVFANLSSESVSFLLVLAVQTFRLMLVSYGTISVYSLNTEWSTIYAQNAAVFIVVDFICLVGLILGKEWGYHLTVASLCIGFLHESTFARIYLLIPDLRVLIIIYFLQFAILSTERFKLRFSSQ